MRGLGCRRVRVLKDAFPQMTVGLMGVAWTNEWPLLVSGNRTSVTGVLSEQCSLSVHAVGDAPLRALSRQGADGTVSLLTWFTV